MSGYAPKSPDLSSFFADPAPLNHPQQQTSVPRDGYYSQPQDQYYQQQPHQQQQQQQQQQHLQPPQPQNYYQGQQDLNVAYSYPTAPPSQGSNYSSHSPNPSYSSHPPPQHLQQQQQQHYYAPISPVQRQPSYSTSAQQQPLSQFQQQQPSPQQQQLYQAPQAYSQNFASPQQQQLPQPPPYPQAQTAYQPPLAPGPTTARSSATTSSPAQPKTKPSPTPKTANMPRKRALADVEAPYVDNSPVKTKFPTARIKRIMQADEEVGKVAQQTPIAVGKALEMFLIALVSKSADVAAERNSKRVTASMLKAVVEGDEQWDFLREIVGKVGEEKEGDGGRKGKAAKAEHTSSDDDSAEPKKRRGRKKKEKA